MAGTRPTPQVDFRGLFYETLGGSKPRRLRYRVRSDSNRPHDLIFLNSLVHDARFHPRQARLHNGKLLIPVVRDCWELGFEHPGPRNELLVCRSLLRFHPVAGLVWELPHGGLESSPFPFWLLKMHFDERPFHDEPGEATVVLEGIDWRARIALERWDGRIEMEDLILPRFWDDHSEVERKRMEGLEAEPRE